MRPTTTDEVLRLLDARFPSAALEAALELGLFWLLAERPRPAEGVADALDMPPARARYWLQTLADAGLLRRAAEGWAPSGVARREILEAYSRDTWSLLAAEARERSPVLRDLARHLSDRGSVWDALGESPPRYVEAMAADPERARRFTRMLAELHRPLAARLARQLDLEGARRLLDLGGGSGVISRALLRRHPALEAVVVDLDTVCAAGRELADDDEDGATDRRLRWHPADFLQDELPGGFDVVLECDVAVYEPGLFRKVRSALAPGGRFVIVDQLATAGRVPRHRLHWALQKALDDPGFRYPDAETLRDRLRACGFEAVSETPLRVEEGADRFTAGFTVLEARIPG